MTCLNCKHNKILRMQDNSKERHWCIVQENRKSINYAKECEFYVPKTNADKIRSMTDEELAEFFFEPNQEFCIKCKYLGSDCDGLYCNESMLEWLKQTAEGE